MRFSVESDLSANNVINLKTEITYRKKSFNYLKQMDPILEKDKSELKNYQGLNPTQILDCIHHSITTIPQNSHSQFDTVGSILIVIILIILVLICLALLVFCVPSETDTETTAKLKLIFQASHIRSFRILQFNCDNELK
jgi:hypothetical protein